MNARASLLLLAATAAWAGCGKKDDGKETAPATALTRLEDATAVRDSSDAAVAEPHLRPDHIPRGPDAAYSRTAEAMGTRISVTIWTDDEAAAARGASAVFAEFERVDKLMTTWLPDSDVSKLNAAAGVEPVKVAPELFGLLQKSLSISRATGGAFDITVGAFRGLWKFDQDLDGSLPSAAAVKERRNLVGYQDLVLDVDTGTAFLRRKGMGVTLGGIAKGYTVDRAVAMLHDRGFVDFIVQAGGDLYVAGRRGDRAWRVGVRDPRGAADDSFALIELENGTFSTSGDYERGLVKGGKRYHHIIDPSTGFPADRCRSVTVLAKDALTADVWSTALFIIGAKEGLPRVEAMKDVEAIFVDADNQVHLSSGLRGRLTMVHPPTDGV
jgi:thiamine biosynthesis lipoprotein